ncbi:hypothetical protein [Sedimentisphaera salicampi]|uniref:hypothetical protein n=1 Tax=Sedimentisphaera salicampi TaxID=1941349 RepID=UPI000B9B0E71|nr:hypothetical protein [Sedimentisphaera salicampi]OXU15719.1 hypothetical protein SMSP1_00505 [Sedimentisphaera salicampi]
MDNQTILTVLGIIVSTILALWAIVVTLKGSRNVKITFVSELLLALTDDITQSFDDLEITFRDKPISSNLVLFRGYFINTGRRDITQEMIEDQISAHLPSEFEWIDCKVTEVSSSLNAEVKVQSKQQIIFSISTGLWKKNEYLKFETLAKVPVVDAAPENPPKEKPADRLRNAITFRHRIADSYRIEETCKPMSKPNRLPFFSSFSNVFLLRNIRIIIGSCFLVVGLALLAAWQTDFMAKKKVGYIATIDGVERLVTVQAKRDGLVLSGEDTFSQKTTLSEFNEMPHKQAVLVTQTEDSLLIIGILYSITGGLFLVLILLRSMKDRRILNLIDSKAKA